jgi:opacity protein-like surface antigen
LIGRRLTLLFLCGGTSVLLAQSLPTASRAGDLQIGAGFIIARPDYVQNTFNGFAAYADFDFRPHLGVEAEFHQIAGDQIHQRTYEIGGRYFRTYGPFVPYVKAMIGSGDFDYPTGLANLVYTMFAVGAGADLKLSDRLHLRGDYEFQKWASFPNGGLTPQLVTIGAAYHFTGKPRYK